MYAMIATDALVFGDDYVYPREAYSTYINRKSYCYGFTYRSYLLHNQNLWRGQATSQYFIRLKYMVDFNILLLYHCHLSPVNFLN